MGSTYVIGPFVLDTDASVLTCAGVPLSLGPRGVAVLTQLVRCPNEYVRKSSILDGAWPDVVVDENNLAVQISAIRRALAKAPGGEHWVETLPRRGYRFVGPVAEIAPPEERVHPVHASRSSIAVLPMANLSDDPANEYFTDGLSEELLNLLARIPGLRVVSRTSSFYFKGKQFDIPTVARALNVATVLEGSVRKVGKRVRVSLQLIDAGTDSHLWSGVYDRTLDDIFAMQDEIARAVVGELRVAMRDATPDATRDAEVAKVVATASRGGTRNAEAYRLQLQGRYFASRANTSDLDKGIEYYHQALELDPGYAKVWVALASVFAAQAGYGRGVPVVEGFWLARSAAQRALDLEPDFPEAHSILGWIRLYGHWDWKGAAEASRRALQLAPDNAFVLHNTFIVAGNSGRHAEAEAQVARALAIDPLNARLHQLMAWCKLHGGELDHADAALARSAALTPGMGLFGMCGGLIRLAQGRLQAALDAFEQEVLADYRLLGIVLGQHALRHFTESAAALDELVRQCGDASPSQIAEAHAGRGEIDRAFEWLDRACAARDPRLVEAPTSVMLRPLHRDGRWQRFLNVIGFEARRIDA